MRLALSLVLATLAPGVLAPGVLAQTCGGDFDAFVSGLKQEAAQRGHDPALIDRFFATVRQDPAVLRADRAQGVFQRDFIDFSRRLISADRLQRAQDNAARLAALFDRIEA